MKHRTVRALVWLGLTAATAAAGVTVVRRGADAATAEMAQVRAALRARHDARLPPRDPAWGARAAGNAFTHYERAAALAAAFDDAADVRPLLAEPDAALHAAPARDAWSPIAAAVLAGAPCDRCDYPRGDRSFGCANMLTYRRAANLSLFEARARRHEGRGHDAVRLTLAVMTMGAACVDDGVLINQMVGAAIVAIAVDAWSDDALRRADDAALRAFAAGLERLDVRLPTTIDLDAELEQMAAALQAVPEQGEWCGPGTWRYGFSTRWMCADAFLALAGAAERLRAAGDRPWPARRRLFERELQALADSPNPAAQVIGPNLDACERQLRWNVAHLRLLRQAIALHLGEPAALPDPLGDGPLQVTRDGAWATLASAGDDDRGQLRRRARPRGQSTGARTNLTNR